MSTPSPEVPSDILPETGGLTVERLVVAMECMERRE